MPLVRSLTLPTMRRRRRSARPQALSCRSPVPVLAAGGSFGWALEIEVEFVQAKLGVSLREVAADAVLGAFTAEVDALPKPSSRRRGSTRAGAAELYNWSVPPEKRLVVGMRLTGIGDISLAGYSYAQVVKELKRAKRPVRLRFADISRSFDTDDASESESDDDSTGTVETLEDANVDELHGNKLERLVDFRSDALARVLVNNEIVAEKGELDRREAAKALALVSAKSLVLSHAVDELHADQRALTDARSLLARDQRRLERVLTELRALEAPGAVNPEKERAKRLDERHQLLTRDIERLKQGNERMRKDRFDWKRQLEELQQQLAEAQPEAEKEAEKAKQQAEEDEVAHDDDEWMADASLAELRAQTRALEEEMDKEQRKLAKARHERDQLRKYDLMQRAMEEEMERRHRKLSVHSHYERNQAFNPGKRQYGTEIEKQRKQSGVRREHDQQRRLSKPHHDMEKIKVRTPSDARPEQDQQRRLSKPHHDMEKIKVRTPSDARPEQDQQRRLSKPHHPLENGQKRRPSSARHDRDQHSKQQVMTPDKKSRPSSVRLDSDPQHRLSKPQQPTEGDKERPISNSRQPRDQVRRNSKPQPQPQLQPQLHQQSREVML